MVAVDICEAAEADTEVEVTIPEVWVVECRTEDSTREATAQGASIKAEVCLCAEAGAATEVASKEIMEEGTETTTEEVILGSKVDTGSRDTMVNKVHKAAKATMEEEGKISSLKTITPMDRSECVRTKMHLLLHI